MQALAGSKLTLHTAGGEFHPAPRTNSHTIMRAARNYALVQNLSSAEREFSASDISVWLQDLRQSLEQDVQQIAFLQRGNAFISNVFSGC